MQLKIQELCGERNMTQKELAAKVGVHEITISRAVKGNASLELLDKIADALSVEIGDLFVSKRSEVFKCPKCGAHLRIVLDE